ncbi:MAG: response regulator [Deferrisomatales bacterium]|nr:response regulator [Deferrisomatales bacterium]
MRVLVVDNDAPFRQALVRFLEQHWEVAEADCAKAALARREHFDLVVTDLRMPGVGGLGLVRRLRADPATARLPIVVISGDFGVQMRDRALVEGASACLEKPFCLDRLCGLVASLGRESEVGGSLPRCAGTAP